MISPNWSDVAYKAADHSQDIHATQGSALAYVAYKAVTHDRKNKRSLVDDMAPHST